ncbi:50S ribosome-binding GTPase family protein [Ehrlichia chaffeensis str. Heartland]|uniref:Ribosome-binding ATPase YchF n=1 Tax=Ehrlichia chaffeensis (strain ATCC CRL-10679 / Arkansas) TaxID=205920 RepID=Q2GHV2_EHRCR|nr:redox-regulated ATPase YchF [Ehrlichia chaffeensis]ABD45401.1 GTP-binding protein YchF [Ehrlichia chaffeensis str. Arkansas]AHX04048.1 50S ribosome-binding GTPase family protein [Ehrlichia chaffeensis str. Heartland]AHX05982.1 50S ribosome-binding GTPase family protein [Ehrlichia chaffeensis str. Jax]AHX06972.1 50S ribosome-binding GTPase family protein [Ehrlichia chaffeensis str. Liberty]AHX07639.1 50S ribosome-binding GTPase family protein [Ehrlichia chaffeensis str. Osceola]
MGLNCGIVGLPNVGKSTLFNALTQTMVAEVANYPFCTIEPNIGKAIVQDHRLKTLANIASSKKIIYNQVECVDIAGLVSGASQGEGLGNKFLSHIREVDAIIHVLRCFGDQNISHVNQTVDPISDAEIVEMELILADIESLKRRLPATEKAVKANKEPRKKLDTILEVLSVLEAGNLAKSAKHLGDDLKQLQLITTKPMMYVCNVEESNVTTGNALSEKVKLMAEKKHNKFCCISAKLEADVSSLETEEEKQIFLAEFNLQESGTTSVVKTMYDLLDMITFFTLGPQEARAWPIKRFSTASSAAGVIHTDFEKGFIKAELISFDDYIKYNGEAKCKEAGKVRFEGRDYIVQDGDIIHFRHNK